jgi:alanine-glyoxylate transaminase/serine-glyoxylate transaminase/serine-pyruvate transaminase
MTVRHGRPFLAIPGPTNIPDAVLAAMHRPAIDIYSGEALEITDRLQQGLKRVFGTVGHVYIYASNGHGGWEAAIANCLSPGDKVLVLESGRFAIGWGQMAETLGAVAERLPGTLRHAVDPNAVEARLRADTGGEIKAILVVQVDTAVGVANDIPAIRRAIDAARHGALLMVDTIASLGCMPFEMDAWGVDVAVAGSQKGLMTPPGLAFVAASDKAMAAHARAGLRSVYWNWTRRDGPLHYEKYCGTPPEHLLFGLDKALALLFDEGMENVFERHRLLAGAVQHAVEVWAEGGAFAFNVERPDERAPSVTTIRMTEGQDPDALADFCRETCGVTLGIGIGELRGRAFRIAHMGHVNAPMILGTLGAVEVGLAALAMPHGRGGIQAAVDWLGASLGAS